MELDWSTFLLQIINFLVLVWILNRFLYKPVMKVIAQRKAAVEKTLADSERARADARALQTQYETRLTEWEREKDKARAQLREDLEAERHRLMAALRAELDQERQAAAVREQRRLAELAQRADQAALEQGGRFVAKLLSGLAGPELEAKIVELMLSEMAQLPEEQLAAIRSALPQDTSVRVVTAYPLSQSLRESLAQMVRRLAGGELRCEYSNDPDLIAGVRVSFGGWVLRANLQDEMKWFSEGVPHGR